MPTEKKPKYIYWPMPKSDGTPAPHTGCLVMATSYRITRGAPDPMWGYALLDCGSSVQMTQGCLVPIDDADEFPDSECRHT